MRTYPRAIILFLVLVFLPEMVLPNDLPPKEKLCPNGDCRGPITITLQKEDGSTFEQKHEYLYPVIQSNGITIFPGEDIKITGNFKDNKLADIKAIRNTDQEPPLITFSFEQTNEKMMILKVVNSSDHDIKYHLAMMPLEEEKLFKTSSCPVLAGKMAFESWPFPIYQLLVPEIFIIEATDQVKCEY